MENKKDIGQAFKDRLNELETAPKDAIWQSIDRDLDKKRKRRIAFFLMSGATAFFILVCSIWLLKGNQKPEVSPAFQNESHLISTENTVQNPETDTVFKNKILRKSQSTTSKKLVNSTEEVDEYEIVTRYKIYVKKTKNIILSKKIVWPNSKKTEKENNKKALPAFSKASKSKIQKNKKTGSSKLFLKSGKFKSHSGKNIKNGKHQKLANSKKNRVQSAKSKEKIAPNNTQNDKELTSEIPKQIEETVSEILQQTALDSACVETTDTVSKKKKRILKERPEAKPQQEENNDQVFISVYVGPEYYNTLSKSSPLLKNGINFDKKGSINLNYGMYVRGMYNEKLGLRFGIVKTDTKFTTTIQNDTGSAWALSNTSIQDFNINEDTFKNYFSESEKIDLIQKVNYLEFPLEAYYVIQDENKIGMDGFAGFSTYFLTQNKVFAASSSQSSIEIGEAKNMKKVGFSLNVGLILHYKLNDSLRLEAMPFLKYQVKSADGFSPLMVSLQAGLSYKL
ncbi:hypothetical protein FNO01nite_01440 [Flavobacterium noncentrifugens]|uniref:Outer membrane protein beta-barrel domain-containing protein n=1 Tax=Flavobacterium noncentrifugens TaxID=1128970 RepID=A0A1G8RKL0_9FLAO|nr:hypothetical protein [Flavobacterium noncentrifugens]GEP49472.1 hypothetical protein FNO01nite_01440 [Flavobacterium noncentrifugens]SDJ17443.1 hypothetical protein SAMN04487935_0163 [Flavobacterium noncentrifugens]